MLEMTIRWVGTLYNFVFNYLLFDVFMPVMEFLALVGASGIVLDAQVAFIVAMPAILIIALVWSRREAFEKRHGCSAASGWKWTITAFAIGWVGVIFAVMQQASAMGAWTAASLAPLHLWPIGLLAMAALTYGTLAAHWLTRKLILRR